MSIINRIEYKGQGIRIVPDAGRFKYEIAYFPVNRNCVFKLFQSLDTYATQDEALKVAKEKIVPEVENGNWERSQIPISELLKEPYQHED